ncbi:MAG: hypothetical protein KA371_22270 [Acidobacteria bacterium]|nr:hypothetical protein [Acidobacteriota bacterium]
MDAIVIDGATVYAGGSFDQVGPLTGPFTVVDPVDPTAFTTGMEVDVNVTAVAPDGAGGWYLATDVFLSTPGPAGLVHLRADGTRDPAWTPPTLNIGRVWAIAAAGGRLFIGGTFNTVNGLPRQGLAALDGATGAVLAWHARLTTTAPSAATAFTLAATASRLYVAGFFDHVEGTARNRFAVIDASTASLLPGELSPTLADPQILSIEVTPTRVFLNGGCRTGGFVICAYDLDMLPLTGWTFPPSPGPIAASSTALFATERVPPSWVRVTRLDPDTGVALPWAAPEIRGSFPQLHSLEVAGNTLFLGGDFLDLNGQPRTRLAAVDATSGTPTSWAPVIGGPVRSVAATANGVGVGGEFFTVGGVPRQNLAAIDLNTGRSLAATPATPFRVKALLKLGDVMVVGGERPFNVAGPDVTAFSTTTGGIIPWSLTSNGQIHALATDGRRLFIGGNFSLLSGNLRLNLASVDLATTALTSWNPSPDQTVRTLAVSAGVVYAAGYFNTLPGYGRPGVTAITPDTGAVLSFNPAAPGGSSVTDFAYFGSRVALIGWPEAFRWVDSGSGAAVPPSSPADIWAAAGAQWGDAIYAVGPRIDGSRTSLVAMDAPSGRTRVLGDFGFGFTPAAVAVNRDYVAVGGYPSLVPTVTRSLAVFHAPRTGAPQRVQASVAGATITLGWEPGTGPTISAFLVEAGTAAGATDVGVFNVGLATRVAGALPPGTYYLRVRGVGAGGPGAASSEVIATVPATSTAPTAPGTLTASVVSGVVTLGWGAAAGNATTYVIEAGTASGLSNIGAMPTGNLDTAWSLPAPSGIYFVRVRAANAFGLSPATSDVLVVVP